MTMRNNEEVIDFLFTVFVCSIIGCAIAVWKLTDNLWLGILVLSSELLLSYLVVYVIESIKEVVQASVNRQPPHST